MVLHKGLLEVQELSVTNKRFLSDLENPAQAISPDSYELRPPYLFKILIRFFSVLCGRENENFEHVVA